MTTGQSIITILFVVLGTMTTRFLPFLIFPEGRTPPRYITYLGTVLPYAVIGLLVVYCLKDAFSGGHFALPELYTIDELTGLIHAACLMRPSKSVLDLEVKSVKKKFKDKRFAAGVDREVIRSGAEMLGMELDDVIRETIEGMKERAEEIGLKGNL